MGFPGGISPYLQELCHPIYNWFSVARLVQLRPSNRRQILRGWTTFTVHRRLLEKNPQQPPGMSKNSRNDGRFSISTGDLLP